MGSDEVWAKCNKCSAQFKKRGTKCPYCGSANIVIPQAVGGHIVYPRGRLRLRQKANGFRKFVKEIVQGWFPSGEPKLSQGVEKERITDKEGDTYDEVVKDVKTGQVIHETHEPLSQHKHQ